MAIIGRLSAFWLNEIIRTAVLFVSAYFLGLWVMRRGVRVNYTRKIQHFTLFFVPMVLAAYIPFTPSLYTVFGSGLVFLASLALFTQPIRSRSTLIATAFASFDRPEDRPYTLLWLSTQILATYVVLVLMLVWLERYEKSILIYITVLVAGIGDGLAEPVGVRFGRHTYTTRALFTKRRYTRSFEGSACVLASGFLAVYLLRGQLDATQFGLALAIVPLAMTLAEAWSPHTWDGPFLYLAGGASTVATLEIARLVP
jgi:dolichol kinase